MSISPIRISLSDLLASPGALRSQLELAFGSDKGCLGIVFVNGLPTEFAQLRKRLFHLAHAFATLPEETRETLSRADSSYLFGWSHGKEVMNGRPDLQKGSFYANPLLDHPDVSPAKKNENPEYETWLMYNWYYAGNVWPTGIDGMEEFEPTFKALGKIIFDVGCAIARACEPFVTRPTTADAPTLEALISRSKSNKARLLHYFPEPLMTGSTSDRVANDALCGTHIDHSLLTGLCSAMYLSQPYPSSLPSPVSAPSSTAGLYIYPRHQPDSPRPDAVKVSIPPDCLAFQTGEALELLTNGRLAATPHFVSGNAAPNPEAGTVSRETFAFFLQPDVDDVIGRDGETFGQFTKRVLGRHYAEDQAGGPKPFKEAED